MWNVDDEPRVPAQCHKTAEKAELTGDIVVYMCLRVGKKKELGGKPQVLSVK